MSARRKHRYRRFDRYYAGSSAESGTAGRWCINCGSVEQRAPYVAATPPADAQGRSPLFPTSPQFGAIVTHEADGIDPDYCDAPKWIARRQRRIARRRNR